MACWGHHDGIQCRIRNVSPESELTRISSSPLSSAPSCDERKAARPTPRTLVNSFGRVPRSGLPPLFAFVSEMEVGFENDGIEASVVSGSRGLKWVDVSWACVMSA